MNPETQVLGMKCLEKLLHQEGYVICQATGQKITEVDDLASVHLGFGEDSLILLPVHKEHAKTLLQTLLKTFSSGLPSLEEKKPLEFHWRE